MNYLNQYRGVIPPEVFSGLELFHEELAKFTESEFMYLLERIKAGDVRAARAPISSAGRKSHCNLFSNSLP